MSAQSRIHTPEQKRQNENVRFGTAQRRDSPEKSIEQGTVNRLDGVDCFETGIKDGRHVKIIQVTLVTRQIIFLLVEAL